MGSWNHDGNQVYTGAAPLGWTVLDLKAKTGGGSTTHPSAKTLALLRVENTAGASFVAFRQNGSGWDSYLTAPLSAGCLSGQVANTPIVAMVLVPTDSSGKIEWISQNAHNTEIFLMGFVEATFPSALLFPSGPLPNVWTDEDATTDTVAAPTGLTGEALAFLLYEKTGGAGSSWFAVRPDGGADEYLGSGKPAACSQGGLNGNGKSNGLACKTNSSGVFQHICQAPVINTTVELVCFEQDRWTDVDTEVFSAAPPPLAWVGSEIDLSPITGAIRALVLLQVHLEDVGGATQRAGFRSSDETKEIYWKDLS